jgi:hypothetical protein
LGKFTIKYFAAQMTTHNDAVTFRTCLHHTLEPQCARGASQTFVVLNAIAAILCASNRARWTRSRSRRIRQLY